MAKLVQRYSHSLTLLTFFFIALTLSLGVWQLERAEEKRLLLESFAANLAAPPVPLAEVRADWQNHPYRKITVSGRYLDGAALLLENQFFQGRAGLHHYQAFQMDTGGILLVNTGWLAPDQPVPALSPEETQLIGLMRAPPEVGLRLGSLDSLPFVAPVRTPYLDLDWLEKRLQLPLEPFILLPDDDSLDRDRWTAVHMPPEKHQSYAITWFTLALFLAIAFLIFTFRQEPGSPRPHE